MARLPRLVVPGLPHLIVHRGHNGAAVFIDDQDRSSYLAALGLMAREFGVDVHAYGLLAGEVRLLVTPHHEAALAAMMQAVGRRYVRSFNLRHGRRSSPWEGRFRSTVVEPGPLVLTCMQVVEAPIEPREGSAEVAQRWTSTARHLGLAQDPLVSEHPAYWSLGNTPFEREAAYRRRMAAGVSSEECRRLLLAASGGWPLGSAVFVAQLAARTGRRTTTLPRGRPAKKT